jgi:peptide/nickel transport system substrate-binding protein
MKTDMRDLRGASKRDNLGNLPRRDLLRLALAGGAVSASGLILPSGARAATPKKGGTLLVGCAGGGAKDTLDAHQAVTYPDIARNFAVYETLATIAPDYSFQMLLATEITPNKTADLWTVKLRKGVTFHNGKPLTADDAIFSIKRIIDPKTPGGGAAGLADIDANGLTKIDDLTFSIKLKRANAIIDRELAQYTNSIIPIGYDVKNPVGTGPFRFGSFTPGDRTHMPAYKDYWRTGLPYVAELVIIDFPDDTARINALMGGQVHVIDNVPFAQTVPLGMTPGLKTLVAKTGGWLPFTMRVDQAPFSDVRVRQAMRLIVDRPQMIAQALSGQGSVANDLFSPFDPSFNHDLPQRHQDLDQAKSLLKAAGHADLTVELVTGDVAAGLVEAAQVFSQQAQGAGVTVNVRKVDSGVFYGDDYLKWTFAQDFWFTRDYLSQVASCQTPTASFNETHWSDPKFEALVSEALTTVDFAKRTELIHAAQAIDYDSGGYIIWGFRDQVDGYSSKIGGLVPSRTGNPLGNYGFAQMYFV